MSKTRPMYVMNEEGLSELEKKAVIDGTKELLRIAEVEDRIKVVDLGAWKHNEYKNSDGSLKEYYSVDWYLQEGRKASRNKTQLNAEKIVRLFYVEPWQKGEQEHYDILITRSDMYSGNANFIIGIAYPVLATVLSTYRFKNLDDKLRYECIKTETMHELGHVFTLPKERIKSDNWVLDGHCPNKCVMRQGMSLPTDWINMTEDRLKYGPFCKPCETYLKEWFKEKPAIGEPKILVKNKRH